MRTVACITQTSVIDQILTHLRTRRPNGPRGAPARWQSRRSPLTGALEAGDRGLYSAHLD
jgi:hypothetical protein